METTKINKDEATKLIDGYKLTLYGRNLVRHRRGLKTLEEMYKDCAIAEVLIRELNTALSNVSNDTEMKLFMGGLENIINF